MSEEERERLNYLRIRQLQRQKKLRRRRPPITTDPNKTLDDTRYDGDKLWDEIEARDK